MNILTYAKKHAVITTVLALAVVFIAIIGGRMASRANVSTDEGNKGRGISLVDASAFRKDGGTVSANGTVESIDQVAIKSQAQAPVSYINVAVGDNVSSGEVIMELRNADIRARLDQAKAALAGAQGQYQTGATSLGSARTTSIDQTKNAYIAVDQAVRGQLDSFLFSSSGGEIPLSSRISDLKLVDTLHAKRNDLDNYFITWKKQIDALSPSSTDKELFDALSLSKTILSAVTSLLDDVSIALNSISKDASAENAAIISGWKTIVSTSKTSITGSSAAVTGADTSLRAALSSQGTTAEANISSAAAGVKSLEAELAKTIVVSPINGKIASLPLRVGELATMGSPLVTVIGGEGLKVKVYVSGEDIGSIEKGDKALIQGSIAGTVTAVAPSVSEVNRKAEVTVSIESKDTKLVVGQNVPVSIKTKVMPKTVGTSYFLPIQNIKIVPGDAYVFTMGDDAKAVKHSVVLGEVSGDFVEVKSGMTDDMKIVTPVYELEEGDVLEVRS